MYLLRRLTPILVAGTLAAGFAALFWRMRFVYALFGEAFIGPTTLGVIAGVLLAVSALGMLNIGAFHPISSRLRFWVFPSILVASVLCLLTLSEPSPMLLGIAAVAVALIWAWYESLYMFWQQPQLYQPYTLQRLSSYLHVFAVFVATAALTGLHVFLQMRFWGTVLLSSLALGALLADVLYLSQLHREKLIPAIGFGILLGAEWFIAVSYLPTHLFFTGVLMAIFLYVWLGVTRLWAQQTWRRAELVPYITIAVSGFLVTIGSTLWIV